MKKHSVKAYLIGCAATAAAGGAAYAGYALYSGSGFVPRSFARAIQSNQVVFGQDGAGRAQGTDEDKRSSLWEKTPDADDTVSTSGDQADYLFESAKTTPQQTVTGSEGESAVIASEQTQEESSALTRAGQSGLVYDLVHGENGTAAEADVILSAPEASVSSASYAGAETAAGVSTGAAPSAAEEGSTSTGSAPQRTSSGNSGETAAGGAGSADAPKDASAITPLPQPAQKPETEKIPEKEPEKPSRPADSAKDPGGSKSNPSGGWIGNSTYNETTVASKDNKRPVIQDAREDIFTEALNRLYLGQSVNERTVYNALNTYVEVDGEWVRYLWGDEDLGRYVRIRRLSFDGGKTWSSLADGAEVTIPSDLSASSGVRIDVSYRLSVQDDWTDMEVTYQPEASRILVLNQVIADENLTLSDEMLVNGTSPKEQYLAKGQTLNLYSLQKNYLGKAENETLPALFAGWTENGEPVSWLYKAKAGRHILEPGDSMAYDTDSYTVKLLHYFLTADGESAGTDELYYLQTLTGYRKENSADGAVLNVPYYVQALDLSDGEDLEVDAVTIPDTVIHIDPEGIQTRQGWIVSGNNPSYRSDEKHVLYDKAGTRLLGMPSALEKLETSSALEQICIPEKNQLKTLVLSGTKSEEAGTGAGLPEINLEELSDCSILLPAGKTLSETGVTAFLKEHAEALAQSTGNTVSFAGEDTSYTVQNGFLVSEDGRICRTLQPQKTMRLPAGSTSVTAAALSEAETLTTLQLSYDGTAPVFEEGALEAGHIARIQCYTQEQQESVLRQVKEQGLSEKIQVTLDDTLEINGFSCSLKERDGEEVLVIEKAPADITVFDEASLPDAGDTKIGAIAAQAFANCRQLALAVLPESVQEIGAEAFKGCEKLEGILSEAQDTILVGDGAFDGCSLLRYAAFNAKSAVWEDGYAPEITDNHDSMSYGVVHAYLFAPSGASGYPEDVTVQFGEDDGVDGYLLVNLAEESQDTGESLALFGGSVDDLSGELYPWLLVRSSHALGAELSLPDTTLEIYNYAFADAAGTDGEGFSLNWESLPWLMAIDEGAFLESDLAGTVSPAGSGMGLYVGDYAFSGCGKLTEFSSDATSYLGKGAFWECASLQRVNLGHMWTSSDLGTLTFYGDTALTEIAISNEEPFRLIPQEPGLVFYFAGEEEDAQLRLSVPEETKDAYIREWVMPLTGYASYREMYEGVYWNMLFDSFDLAVDPAEVHAACEEKLLAAENRLRSLLGLAGTDQLTYPISEEERASAESDPWGVDELSLLSDETAKATVDTAADTPADKAADASTESVSDTAADTDSTAETAQQHSTEEAQ